MKRILSITVMTLAFAVSVECKILESIDAVVNGEAILSGEVDERLRLMIGDRMNAMSEEEILEERRKLVVSMIEETLILNEARQRLPRDRWEEITLRVEEQTNQDMTQLLRQVTTPEQVAMAERQMGMSWEDLRRARKKMNEREYLRTRIAPRLTPNQPEPPTPEEIGKFKAENPGVQPGDEITVAHVLVRVPDGVSERMENQALLRAMEVSLRAKEEESFERLVAIYSEHEPTRSRGGLLNPFKKGAYMAEFDQLFDLDEGAITDPIRTRLGYHIIKIVDKPSYEDIVMQKKQEEAVRAWIDELRQKAKIEIRQDEVLEEAFNRLREKATQQP